MIIPYLLHPQVKQRDWFADCTLIISIAKYFREGLLMFVKRFTGINRPSQKYLDILIYWQSIVKKENIQRLNRKGVLI